MSLTIEEGGREELGYKLHDEQFLVCPGCDAKLASVIVVKLNESMNFGKVIVDKAEFQAECPKCKITSYKKTFTNVKVYYGPVEPYAITDVQFELSDKTGKVIIKVAK